jgi:hypothetical protein
LISSAISTDSHYCLLFDYVGYEYLSKSSMSSFFDLVSNSFHFLTVSLWTRLRSRLIDGISECKSPRISEPHFLFRNGSPFKGIISYLTKKCGGNVSDCGIVSVTSSSVYSSRARNVVDLTGLSHTQTANIADSWICYDFKNMRLQVNHYSIRSRNDHDSHHPTTWIVEGSMEGSNWFELDCQTNRSELRGINKSATFSTSVNQFLRMIRLRQTGKNSSSYDYLTVSALEVFGTVRGLGDSTAACFLSSSHINAIRSGAVQLSPLFCNRSLGSPMKLCDLQSDDIGPRRTPK